jgi:hypothetical protein
MLSDSRQQPTEVLGPRRPLPELRNLRIVIFVYRGGTGSRQPAQEHRGDRQANTQTAEYE